MPHEQLLFTAETVDGPTAEDLWLHARVEAANLRRGLEGYQEREQLVRGIAERALEGPWHAEASAILDILDGANDA